jgi:thioredoxin reductase
MELGQLMLKQARNSGWSLTAEILGLEISGRQKMVTTSEGKLTSPAVIVALGSEVSAGVPGRRILGRSVLLRHHDAAFFRNNDLAVVGEEFRYLGSSSSAQFAPKWRNSSQDQFGPRISKKKAR